MNDQEDKTKEETSEDGSGAGEVQATGQSAATADDTATDKTVTVESTEPTVDPDGMEGQSTEPEADSAEQQKEGEEQQAAGDEDDATGVTEEAEVAEPAQEAEEAEEQAEVEPEVEEPPSPPGFAAPLALAFSTLLDEKTQTRDRWLRTAADFENYKKRSRRDIVERAKQAEDRLILDFLPVVDNLERALEHSDGESTDGGLVNGVQMVHKQFLSTLERNGITPCKALGETFNPEFHEAIQQMHADQPAGTVCNVLQQGFRRRERLVRAALVVVSLGPKETPTELEPEPEPLRDEPPVEPREAAVEHEQAATETVGVTATRETVEEPPNIVIPMPPLAFSR